MCGFGAVVDVLFQQWRLLFFRSHFAHLVISFAGARLCVRDAGAGRRLHSVW